MLDAYKREINYLRISVTDRCNLHCNYCMCGNEVNFIKVGHILSFEEIYEFTKKSVEFGVNKVRLTGGEPLVRKNISRLIKMLAAIKEIKDLSMTTNGILLYEQAEELKKAGLGRLNVSLDTMNPETYKKITLNGDVMMVLKGLQRAKEVGFYPIKVNCVINSSPEEKDAVDVAAYCRDNGFFIRFIRKMDIDKGKFWPVIGGDGGNCSRCSRLRLSSDGKIYPCLFSDRCYSIKELGIEEALRQSINNKPESGDRAGNKFYTLGG